MKKIFFMAVSAVLLAAGCQTTEIQNEALPQIGFKTQMGKLTKADPDAGNVGQFDNLQAQGFMVWGYFATENDLNYNRYDNYFVEDTTDGIEVTHKDGAWSTGDNVYYWPGKGKELDLYAVSLWNNQTPPQDENVNTYKNNVTIDPVNKTLAINSFAVNSKADDDLMVAPLITQDQDDSEYVEPQFQHALSKVLVKFATTAPVVETKDGEGNVISSTNGVYVVSAQITNVNSVADLAITNTVNTVTSGPTTYTASLDWKNEKTSKNYVADYDGTVESVKAGPSGCKVEDLKSLNAYAVPTLATNDDYITFGSWLLIPQDDIEAVTLEVVYIVDNVLINQTFKLKTTTAPSWPHGKQTTYNVKITPEYITFEPEVEDWLNDYDENRGDYEEETQQPSTPVYNSVTTSYKAEGSTDTIEVVLYYEGSLAKDASVLVKNNDKYEAASTGTYSFEDSTKATVLIVADGKITEMSETPKK